jgi:hypothetical protein
MTQEILQSERTLFRTIVILCIMCVTLPFFFVRFIPSTDLPQHLAQIRLLHDVLTSPAQAEYSIDWLGANTLVYYLIQLNWLVFDPILTGKMAVLEIALCWLIGIFALARHRRRSVFVAIIASVFIFNSNFYWGFLNFLIGFPVFILWYIYVVDNKKERSDLNKIILITSISFLLFLAHTLWLLIAILHLFLTTIRQRPGVKEIGIRCIALAPIGIYSGIWFLRLAAVRETLGFDTTAHWIVLPWKRLEPSWVLDSVLGGLRGPAEAIIFMGVIVWIGLSLFTNWKEFHANIDWEFLSIGSLLTLIVFVAPEKYINTIFFASRWAPIAMIFFLLALPHPKKSERVVFAYATLLLIVLSFTTCLFWYRYEKTENNGLSESLKALPENARVMGLDFVQRSEILCGRPFLQSFAYAQVLHGGRVNFSFAEHHSGIVSYLKNDTIQKWTPGLEWRADRVRYKDFFQFDYVMMNGNEAIHKQVGSLPVLKPVTKDGLWRLYQCGKDTTIDVSRK